LAAPFIWMGCQTKTPPFAVATPQPDYYNILTYAPGSITINPSLPIVIPGQPLGSVMIPPPPPANVSYESYPTNITVINQPLTLHGTTCTVPGCSIQPTSASGFVVENSGLADYPYDAHIQAWIEDPESAAYSPGPGNYDSVFFRAWPNFTTNNLMFDVSAYSGIQFYIKVSGIDNAVVKQFHIVTDQTTKSPGVCGSLGAPNLVHCYDDFYYDWSAVPRDEWVLVEQRWDAFKMYGNGSITNPPTFSGANLQQVFNFSWIEGNGALAGPVTVDFAVTGAKFF